MANADITALVIETKSVGIKEASNALGGLSTSANNAEKRITSLISAMDKINAVNRASTAGADAYMAKLREQAALMQGMAANSRTAAGGTQALAAAMALLSSSLNLMNQNLQRADVHQRAHNNSMREAHSLARGLSGSLGALWMTYSSFTGMAVGVAIGASLKGIITIGKDVEHTLEGIRVRGNETVESINNIRDAVMDLGKGVYGPQEVAKAFETLILAGLKADQAISSIGAALNLATVGGVSIEKAATTLVSVGTAIGYTAEGFGRVGDVIAKTAALSMSSVETLSQAFKSASSVNRLYGISLEDIGTSLGVLSNLGIQGSAAGTALKNFYKELAAESDKVGSTLNKMQLSQAAFKDADGNFKPLLEVVTLLDEGMNRLSKGEAKLAQGRLSNERGQRLMTQLLGEYNTKLGDSDNALAKFRRNVENSYGFAAKGAVQMSLTAKSQIDSMFNTLKTSFAETFASIQPEVIAFSARMKSVFGSKDFKDAIAELARWFGKLAMAIADNIPLLTNLAIGLIAVKAAMIGGAIWQAAAVGITAVGTAITGLMAGTLTLTAAMPALAIVLGVVAVAWTAYNLAKGEDTQKQIKDAQAYSSGYIAGLTKEAEHLDKVNSKMRDKKSLYDATKDVERDESRQMMVKLDNKAIVEAEKNLHDVTSKFRFNKTAQLIEQKAAQTALDKARENATNNLKLAAAAESTLYTKAKENADLAKAQADAARTPAEHKVTATLGGAPDIAGINDAYHEAIKLQEGYLKQAANAQSAYEKQQNSLFKSGLISKLEMIESVGTAQIAASMKAQIALQAQEDAANNRKNGKADAQGFHDKRMQEITDQAARANQVELDSAAYIQSVRQASAKLEIRELEDKGQFVEAAQKRYEGDTKAMYNEVALAAEKYGDKFPELIEYMKQLEATQKAAMDVAGVKEAVHEFDILHGTLANLFKGLVAENEGEGMAAMFAAALEASEKYKASLPALAAALEKVRNTGDSKAYNEELSKQKGLANNQKTMWASVGESISKSLTKAFGDSGKALGEMVKIGVAYNNSEDQSAQGRVAMYGNMAGAAQGFFDKQSTGYKVMGQISQAFHLAEMAMQMASIGPKLMAGAATMFGQGGFAGFAGVALMGAVMAGLGFAMSGGGSSGLAEAQEAQKKRIETQGTGTVLGDGDAKSESIQNSLDLLTQYTFEELEYSNKMLTAMQSIASALTGVSKSLVLTQGLMSGTAFNTLEGKAAGGWGSVPVLGKLLGSIFGGGTSSNIVGSGIRVAGTVGGLADKQGTFDQYETVSNTRKGGWFRSDKSWITEQLQGLDEDVVSSFSKTFASVRNGLVEVGTTLGLGAVELADKINAIPINISVELRGLKGKELEEALTSVFSANIDLITKQALDIVIPYQKMGEGLLETAVRVADTFRVIDLQLQAINMTFGAVGVASMEARMGFIELMGGLEEFTSKTEFFKENFLTDAQRLAPVQAALTKEMARLEQSSITTIEQFTALAQSQDLSTQAGQEMYVALMNVAPAFKTVADAAEEAAQAAIDTADQLQASLYDTASNAFSALEKSIGKEKEAAQAAYDAQIAIIKAQRTSAETIFKQSKVALDATLKTSQDANTALKSLASSLKSTLDGMFLVTQQASRRADAQESISNALAIARSTGVMPTAESLSDALRVVSQPAENLFSTFEDYARDFGITKGNITNLKDLTDKAVIKSETAIDIAKQQLEVLESQYKLAQESFDLKEVAAKKYYDDSITRLDALLVSAQSQLDVANGTNVAILSLTDAIINFASALSSAMAAKAAVSPPATSKDITGLYSTILGREPDKAGQAYWEERAQGGASTTQIASEFYKSSEYVLTNLYKTALGRAPDAAGLAWWTDAMNNGASVEDVTKGFYTSEEYKSLNGSHFNGLDRVPFDGYRAELHAGERVQTARAARDSDNMAAEIRAMKVELSAALLAIAQSTAKSAKVLDKFDGDGMPDVRDVTA